MHLHTRHFLILAELAFVLACAGMLFNIAPDTAHAATPTVASQKLEVSGWIPYWRTETGIADVLPHLSQMTEVNPFGYTVKKDGTLYDAAGIEEGKWDTLIKAAKANKVRVVPTVMWSDTESIGKILGSKKLRAKHEDAIVRMVTKNNFDGVDIDYEGKRASDRENYALFLKELSKKLGNKWLMCTIEARTPPDSLYKTIPKDLEYANDYKAINTYCDRVRLMTYDQQSADIKLNVASKGLYTPVADPAWVEKVVNFTAKDIAKSKLSIGIATYGYIYQVMPYSDGSGYRYDLLEAFNPRYATDLAKSLNITPSRNSAGEMSFSYVPVELSRNGLPTQSQLQAYAPKGTPTSLLAAVGALQLAKAKTKQAPFYLLWWSDAKAIGDKVALAKRLGVRGVSVFKMDGGEDPGMWAVLK
jgi:spore germination protein YaaH